MRNLTIYVKDNSFPCAEAIDLASRIKGRLPQVELEIVNIDRSRDDNSIIVNEEPVLSVARGVVPVMMGTTSSIVFTTVTSMLRPPNATSVSVPR